MKPSTTRSTGQKRYLSTNATDSSFPTINAVSATVQGTIFSLGGAPGDRFRGAIITPYGVGSATNTFDYRVYAVLKTVAADSKGNAVVSYEYQMLCSGTCTLGTTVGVAANDGVGSGEKYCDTVTCSPQAYASAIVPAYGGVAPSAFSPGSNGIGKILVPDTGNADICITVDMTGATSANFLIEAVN